MKRVPSFGAWFASLLAVWALLGYGAAWSQAYPNRPIKLIVPSAAGGGNDFIARVVARKLEEAFKQSVVVENKPGASGIIATDFVAKAPADGYTLLFNGPLLVQAAGLYNKLPYDPLRDFTPLTDVIRTPLWFAVNASKVSARTLSEFFDEMKAHPAEASYSSVGNGSSHHLYGFALGEAGGLKFLHVPYKGGAPAMVALVGGDVAATFADYVSLKPFVASGKVRLLAVTGTKRHTLTPEVPTLSELGYAGFEAYGWGALFVPSKTPPDIVQTLEAEIVKLLRQPDVIAQFRDVGFELGGMPQPQFAAQVKTDFVRWTTLIKKAGVTLD